MAELFQTTPQNINIHLKHIFSEGEISQDSVIKDSLITASDDKKYRTQLYRCAFADMKKIIKDTGSYCCIFAAVAHKTTQDFTDFHIEGNFLIP